MGFSSIGYFVDNRGEFFNVKMDEFVSNLGFNIQFRPEYSPWSNIIHGINHASPEITIKKLLKDKKV